MTDRRWFFIWLLLLLVLPAGRWGTSAAAPSAQENWPQWRGPLLTGEAPMANPPVTWSETNNVRWKTKLPGAGTATPIVWEDQIFILTAIPTSKKTETKPGAAGEVYRFDVLSYSRKDGKLQWQKTAREEAPHEGHHQNHGFASASPVTDGEYLLAYFGSRGLHCYDLNGNLKWSKDFGHMQTKMGFGEAASPALHGNTVVINWDHEGDDFIVGLDKRTGKELWRTPRDEKTGWSTPLIVEHAGSWQVVVNATDKVRSYDLTTGKELWSCAGQTANAIPTPVGAGDTVYITSGFRGAALFAIGLGRTGDLAGTDAIRWTHNKNTPYVPSPLLAGDLIYVVKGNDAILSCIDRRNGTPFFEAERLAGLREIYASPVSTKDKVYVLGRDGTCLVLKRGPQLEIVATNKLPDKTDATPALVGDEIILRGQDYLYCIGEQAQSKVALAR